MFIICHLLHVVYLDLQKTKQSKTSGYHGKSTKDGLNPLYQKIEENVSARARIGDLSRVSRM